MNDPIDQEQRNSQQLLAESIARAIVAELPQSGSTDELAGSVEEALRKEAMHFEITMAYLRCVFLAALAAFSVFAWLQPEDFEIAVISTLAPFVTAAALAAALVFAVLLHRGWYRPALRRLIPFFDAIIIISTFAVIYNSMRPFWERSPAGITALGAAACGFLAFSGSLRLSRTSGSFSTALSCMVWLALGVIAELRTFEVLLILLTIAATGVMGTRLSRIIRRVVTNEVTRLRLVKLYEDARESVSAQKEVLNIVSHDLRNPLNLIAMTTDLIRDEVIPENQRKHYLDMISRSGNRMNRMIQDLLDVARIERGRIAIEPVQSRLADIVDEAIEMMAPLALERGIALDSELPADLPSINADRERIVQLFSNLVGNALKFTPSGGTVCIRAARLDDGVRVSVCDSGPGVPSEQIDNIFTSFWQARKADRRGIGLGLTISRAIVEAHGGKIGVENSPDSGAIFWFTLPVAQ
jgi:signal transduction histidine kinase